MRVRWEVLRRSVVVRLDLRLWCWLLIGREHVTVTRFWLLIGREDVTVMRFWLLIG